MASPDRWVEVQRIVESALELPPQERPDFIAVACGSDVRLRDEVLKLAQACEAANASDFLNLPALSVAAPVIAEVAISGDPPGPEEATFQILQRALADRYTLAGTLGRGGMAAVFLATDLRHGRQVALKVMNPALLPSASADRFLREIQLVAQLTHPHILPLYDSGEADGLLYYVMPFITGESLRTRLERGGRLTPADALLILREVGSALDFAHRNGVVHRDIKPENILLQDGHAIVADFGIARALGRALGARAPVPTSLTQAGAMLGTPAYMAPEQIAGATTADGRVDLYALGVVAYEMLAGTHPFVGRAPEALLAAHLAEVPPPLHLQQGAVPPDLSDLIHRLLAKRPDDRPADAAVFLAEVDHLARGLAAGTSRPSPPRSRMAFRSLILRVLLTGGAGLAVIFGLRTAAARRGDPGSSTEPDSMRYVVLPFTDAADRLEEQLVRDAFTRWEGIQVVDRFQVDDAVARAGRLTPGAARRIARSLGAGRFVRGEMGQLPTGDRITAVVFDSRSGRQLVHSTMDLPEDGSTTDSLIRILVDRLLFPDLPPAGREPAVTGTRSVPARRALTAGHAALSRWSLAQADSAYEFALTTDPTYSEAALWLALTRMWAGRPISSWSFASERAESGRDRLSARDRIRATAVGLVARSDFPNACSVWRQLTRDQPNDFVGWYSLGSCIGRDRAVIRHLPSPSGWRFRSSRHEAQQAHVRAFELLPSIHLGLSADAFAEVRRNLITSLSMVRPGLAAPPDTGAFFAYPAWEGDSLVLIPFRAADVRDGRALLRVAPGLPEVLARQRQTFHGITSRWVAAYPGSAAALEALAVALEMLGSSSAIDTVRKARRLAVDAESRLRIATTELWMRLRLALPDDSAGLGVVAAMADSLLRRAPVAPPHEAGMLAPIASLTGRVNLAATLSRRSTGRQSWSVPAALAGDGLAVLAYAAVAAPAESLTALEHRIVSVIDRYPDASSRTTDLIEWIGRPARMVFPIHRFATLEKLSGYRDVLIDAQVAWARGDSATTRQKLHGLHAGRASLPAHEVTVDGLLPEVQLLALLGDRDSAAALLDRTLESQRWTDPRLMADVARAGMLVRAMAWRAELAASVRDPVATRRWARPVALLWSAADSSLRRMVPARGH